MFMVIRCNSSVIRSFPLWTNTERTGTNYDTGTIYQIVHVQASTYVIDRKVHIFLNVHMLVRTVRTLEKWNLITWTVKTIQYRYCTVQVSSSLRHGDGSYVRTGSVLEYFFLVYVWIIWIDLNVLGLSYKLQLLTESI